MLLAHVLGVDRTWLFAHADAPLSAEKYARFEQLIARRAKFEPVAYLIGEREFFGLPFFVSPAVLVPRPETEMLVEMALAHLPQKTARVMDVGTGSGCIAVSLAVQCSALRVFATDISAAALAVAQKNVRRHGVQTQVSLMQMNLLAGIRGKVDAIISNPPYISWQEAAELPPTVQKFEPHAALFSAEAGLAHIKQLLRAAPSLLGDKGVLLVEFGAAQGAAILSLARTMSPHATFAITQDLAGKDRVLLGEYHR